MERRSSNGLRIGRGAGFSRALRGGDRRSNELPICIEDRPLREEEFRRRGRWGGPDREVAPPGGFFGCRGCRGICAVLESTA